MDVSIRSATLDDVPAIAKIYNHAVLNTTATFDTTEKSIENRRQWFLSHDENHPILVAQNHEGVVGWASLTRFDAREAYAGTAEFSFYVAERWRGRGIGNRLIKATVEVAETTQLRTILARIAGENPASVHMHQSAGFSDVGVMKNVGLKFGQLLDVRIMQFMLHSDCYREEEDNA